MSQRVAQAKSKGFGFSTGWLDNRAAREWTSYRPSCHPGSEAKLDPTPLFWCQRFLSPMGRTLRCVLCTLSLGLLTPNRGGHLRLFDSTVHKLRRRPPGPDSSPASHIPQGRVRKNEGEFNSLRLQLPLAFSIFWGSQHIHFQKGLPAASC